MRDEIEIIKAACGLDENGEPRSVVRMEAKILHLSGEGSEETLSEMTLDDPCVNIHRSFRYTMVDLEFGDSKNEEYTRSVKILKESTSPEQSIDLENDRVPTLVLTVVPKEFDGEYFICGMHGTWCLMPSVPDQPADTVRFLFENELIHTFKLDDEAISEGENEADEDVDIMYGESTEEDREDTTYEED